MQIHKRRTDIAHKQCRAMGAFKETYTHTHTRARSHVHTLGQRIACVQHIHMSVHLSVFQISIFKNEYAGPYVNVNTYIHMHIYIHKYVHCCLQPSFRQTFIKMYQPTCNHIYVGTFTHVLFLYISVCMCVRK